MVRYSATARPSVRWPSRHQTFDWTSGLDPGLNSLRHLSLPAEDNLAHAALAKAVLEQNQVGACSAGQALPASASPEGTRSLAEPTLLADNRGARAPSLHWFLTDECSRTINEGSQVLEQGAHHTHPEQRRARQTRAVLGRRRHGDLQRGC